MAEIFQPYLRKQEEERMEREPGIFGTEQSVIQDLVLDIYYY